MKNIRTVIDQTGGLLVYEGEMLVSATYLVDDGVVTVKCPMTVEDLGMLIDRGAFGTSSREMANGHDVDG